MSEIGEFSIAVKPDTSKLRGFLKVVEESAAVVAEQLAQLEGDEAETKARAGGVEVPESPKVLFYSEDGSNFRLFVDGHEIQMTQGVKIEAGGVDGLVRVTTTVVTAPGMDTIQPSQVEIKTQ